MEQYQEIAGVIALTMGAAWASGINLYAAMFTLGLLGASGNASLPPSLEVLSNSWVITASGVLFFVEFFADKIPGVDSLWDVVHTFIRIPAAAVIAAAAVADINPAVSIVAAMLGGSVAAAAHATKAGTRLIINTSPEPASNWIASLTEDAAVVAGIWTALNFPILFLGLLLCFILAALWFLPRLFTAVKKLVRLFLGSAQRLSGPENNPANALKSSADPSPDSA